MVPGISFVQDRRNYEQLSTLRGMDRRNYEQLSTLRGIRAVTIFEPVDGPGIKDT